MAKRKRGAPIDDLPIEEQYRVLAQRADKRLERLEKYSNKPGYEDILKGAYSRAMRDIEVWKGAGKKRFGMEKISDPEELQAKINDIKAFLRSDTSSLKPGLDTRGYAISVYEKMANTFNSNYGSNLSWKEIGSYYQSAKAKRIQEQLKASKTIAIALGEFKRLNRKNPDKTIKEWKKDIKENGNQILSDDKAVARMMERIIKMGISPRKLFNEV